MRGMIRKPIIASYLVFAMIAALLIAFQGGCQSSSTSSTATSSATPAETAGTPAAINTVTITSSDTPKPTPEASATPEKKSEVQPYSLSKGRRDPFVPFGGAAPSSGGGTQTKAPDPTIQVSKAPDGKAPSVAPPVSTGGQESAMPESVPVQVTGTYASGGKNFAILTSASGGPSFVVSTGDKVGEYKVKSISGTRVVLSWSGKDYVLKMKTFGPSGSGSKATVTEEPNKPKTLQAPAKPAAPPGGGQPQTAPPAGEKPKPEAPPGGGAEKPKGTEAQ